MSLRNLTDLLVLAALWGASFLFMRLGAAEFGPVPLAGMRVSFAALALLPFLTAQGLWPQIRQHWRALLFVGVVNSALPFLAYAYAALSISAGMSAVFNASTPLWGALVAWVWLHDKPSASRSAGLAIGFLGVAWLLWDKAQLKPNAAESAAMSAMLACLAATLGYGIAANFTKRHLSGVAPMTVAAGSQMSAAVALALPAGWMWPASMPGAAAWASVVTLGMVCTGAAYWLYFRLIAHVGPAKAVSVTFLIPVFAMLWGALFLGESVNAVMAGACAVIVLGTGLATGLWRRSRSA